MFRRRRLGDELRALREAKGYTLQQLAGELGWSHAKISRLENARVRPDLADVMDILELLGVSGEQERRLVALARQANQRGWWRAPDLQDVHAAMTPAEVQFHRVVHYVAGVARAWGITGELLDVMLETAKRNCHDHVPVSSGPRPD
jgi:transcriptional regulator with XRE-family HTH domain